ncbi:MAG: hypothetical protein JXA69_05660 [Phycisphaerae bacterium]|nr:hypothetical protein [Phycisphaerae bacterium]
MKRVSKTLGWATLAGCLILSSGCLPDNFWSDKAGEIVNRGIFGAINAVLSAATNGAIQI